MSSIYDDDLVKLLYRVFDSEPTFAASTRSIVNSLLPMLESRHKGLEAFCADLVEEIVVHGSFFFYLDKEANATCASLRLYNVQRLNRGSCVAIERNSGKRQRVLSFFLSRDTESPKSIVTSCLRQVKILIELESLMLRSLRFQSQPLLAIQKTTDISLDKSIKGFVSRTAAGYELDALGMQEDGQAVVAELARLQAQNLKLTRDQANQSNLRARSVQEQAITRLDAETRIPFVPNGDANTSAFLAADHVQLFPLSDNFVVAGTQPIVSGPSIRDVTRYRLNVEQRIADAFSGVHNARRFASFDNNQIDDPHIKLDASSQAAFYLSILDGVVATLADEARKGTRAR